MCSLREYPRARAGVLSLLSFLSLGKEETWRFSGLLIAGPACSVISWSSIAAAASLELSVVSFPLFPSWFYQYPSQIYIRG